METKTGICERCGEPGAHEFENAWYCNQCYQIVSSSDLEEGGDDLWKGVEQSEQERHSDEKGASAPKKTGKAAA